jgi:serine/threonine-protein kinase
LIHPNIVQVYDVGKIDSIHYIAQEYVPGSNLHAYIQRRGALPLAESISILWQTTAALQKASSIGLVHRDIKPDNLLLTPDGEVKVADFGLARARGQSQNLTAVGVALGTPLYMSPEQIQGLAVDSRSDLYSLGATAYHMLSGRPPFSGETNIALAMQHVQAVPAPLKQIRPDLPDSLVAVVHKLLSKTPEERYATASELSRALKEVIDSELGGNVDQMIPFAGLVIEHQRISNLAATQALQQLAIQGQRSEPSSPKRKYRGMIAKSIAMLVLGAMAFGVVYSSKKKPLFRTEVSTVGVVPQSSIEKQFALALVQNTIGHFRAVSDNFPATNAISRNYRIKAELQIARKQIEGEKYTAAEETLRKVITADQPEKDIVLMTIARIELAWVCDMLKKTGEAQGLYDEASRVMRTLEENPEKYRLILDALPIRVKLEWDNREANLVETSA